MTELSPVKPVQILKVGPHHRGPSATSFCTEFLRGVCTVQHASLQEASPCATYPLFAAVVHFLKESRAL